MATHLKTDGTSIEVSPKHGNTFSLEELQSYVGGYFELVKVKPLNYLVVNEDGYMRNLPVNEAATKIYRENTKPNTHIILGDCLLCDYDQID